MNGLSTATISLVGILFVGVVSACSSDDDSHKDKKASAASGFPTQINPAAQGDAFISPFDATPDADGKNVYFTALTREGEPGVFKVAAGGGAITRLHVGAPLSTPFGIAITEDGKTLVVADADAERGEADDGGGLYTLSVDGSTPTILGGTEGLYPRGLEVKEGDVYFAGVGKDRQAGVYKIPLSGGVAAPVAVGAPFSDPSGVAIRKNGEVYVADSTSDGLGSAVIKIVQNETGAKAEIFQSGLAVGHPAGVALASDDSALFVSGLDQEHGTDVVFRFDLATGEQKTFDNVIKDFQESAGLHRAKKADVFAWADSRANGSGTVYVLSN
jgi:DNA-binding beta-propeller fold protein YncE